jgi:hypothetical protein
MTLIYSLLMIAVGLAVLAVGIDAIVSVTRRPCWHTSPTRPMLSAIETVDRRQAQLPYVGVDRRKAGTDALKQEERRAA